MSSNKIGEMILSRRNFLSISSLALASCVISPKIASPKKLGRLMFTYLTGNPTKHYIMLMDLDENRADFFETPQNVHFLEPFDLNKQIYIGSTKYGSYLSVVDLKTFKTNAIEMPKDLLLMGHTAVTPDGKFICATARKESTQTNCIAFLNRETFAPFDLIDLPEGYPPNHDCKFLPNSNLLATTAASNISFVDYKTKKVRIEVVAFENPMSQVRHFTISPNGRLAIQSNVMFGVEPSAVNYSQGAIVVHDSKENSSRVLSPIIENENVFNRELLDFQFDPSGEFFGATALNYNQVTFWSFKTGKLIGIVPMELPLRITLSANKEYFIVLSGKGVRYINARTLKMIEKMNQFDSIMEERLLKNYRNGIYTIVAHRQTLA